MRIVLLFAILLSFVHVQAQQVYMHVKLKGGGTSSFVVQDIRKVAFDPRPTGTRDDRIQSVIKTFTLLQNYPNPFNPSTTIEYQLPRAGTVDIKVFDLSGRQVRNLSSDHQEVGTHSIRWDGKNDEGQSAASGIYFYQVRFDNSVLSRKMLLLK